MARPTIIIDTGVIVAAIIQSEQHHHWADEQFRTLHGPFYTCEAVLTETIYLIQSEKDTKRIDTKKGVDAVLELVADGVITVDFRFSHHHDRIRTLMAKYYPKMDFADACLVAMTEQTIYKNPLVITLDKTDFSTYRRYTTKEIPFKAP